MHRAYDNGLIFLDTSCVLRLNDKKVGILEDQDRGGGGIDQVELYLSEEIHLPDEDENHPDPRYIRQANECRRI